MRSASPADQTAWASWGWAWPGRWGWGCRPGQTPSHLRQRIHASETAGRRNPSWSGTMVMALTGHTEAQAVHPVQSAALHSWGPLGPGVSSGTAGRGAPSIAAFR